MRLEPYRLWARRVIIAVAAGAAAWLIVLYLLPGEPQPAPAISVRQDHGLTERMVPPAAPDPEAPLHAPRKAPSRPPEATFAVPLRWVSPMVEYDIPVQVTDLEGEGAHTGNVLGGYLYLSEALADRWVCVECAALWFPVTELRATADTLHVRRTARGAVDPAPWLPVVEMIPVKLRAAFRDFDPPAGEAPEVTLFGQLWGDGYHDVAMSYRMIRWSRDITVPLSPQDLLPVLVPRRPLGCVGWDSNHPARQWGVVAFSHRGEAPERDDILEVTLTRIVQCHFEVHESSPGDFAGCLEYAEAARRAKAEAEAASRPSVFRAPPGSQVVPPPALFAEVMLSDAGTGRQLRTLEHQIELATVTSGIGVVYSFKMQLIGPPFSQDLEFVLLARADRLPLARGAARFTEGAVDQYVRLDSARYGSQGLPLAFVRESGSPVPFVAVTLEVAVDRGTRPVQLYRQELRADAEGRLALSRVPRLRDAVVCIRCRFSYGELAGSDRGGMVAIDPEFTELRTLVVKGDAAPLSLLFKSAGGPVPPFATYFITAKPGTGDDAEYRHNSKVLEGAVHTNIRRAGAYVVVIVHMNSCFTAEVEYDPSRSPICEVAVPALHEVELVSTQAMFVAPPELDRLTAWVLCNMPEIDRRGLFHYLTLRPGKPAVVRMATPESLTTGGFGVTGDGAFVAITWRERAGPGRPAYEVGETAPGANGRLKVEVVASDLAALRKQIPNPMLNITAVFRDEPASTTATTGLGRQVPLAGAETEIDSLPPGRYYVCVVGEGPDHSPGSVVQGWHRVVEIRDGQTTAIQLPGK